MSNEKQINDLVNMLDQFVLAGGGHMNVEVEDSSRLDEVQVETTKSNCCQKIWHAKSLPYMKELMVKNN